MRKSILTIALLALAGTAHAVAGTVVVTPTDLQGWVSDDTRLPGTAAITPTYAQSGNGSFEFTTTNATAKANATLGWTTTFASAASPFGVATTIGNLSSLTYDWYRSSASTSVASEMPALRFYFYNANTKQAGSLVYELAYNGSTNAPTDTWQTADFTSAQVWMRTTVNLDDPSKMMTVADWINPAKTKPSGAYLIDAATYIYGVSASVGSGIDGIYSGAVDNIQVGFTGGSTNTYNFEVSAVPEPSAFALGGLGLLGLGVVVFRRRQVAA